MGRKRLAVEGMACDGCEENVENALKGLDGISRVAADHETDTVELVLVDEVDDATIHAAVEGAGYHIVA